MATAARRKRKTRPEPALDLDALHEMTFDELDALYRRLHAPETVMELDGRPEGRMLALGNTRNGPLARAVRAFSKSSAFVWLGKNFSSEVADEGEGINRINLLGLYRPLWFRFETSLEPSLVDGKRCFRLNYGLAENPPGIRHIVDELREAGPGLYLGPAQLVVGDREPFTVLYFALQY